MTLIRQTEVAAVVVLAAFTLGACSFSMGSSHSSGPKTFTGQGVNFTYPGSWNAVKIGDVTASSASAPLWQESFGSSATDFAIIAQYTVPTPIDVNNLNVAKSPITSSVTNLFAQAGGSLDSGPTQGTTGGFPSLEYTGTAKTPDGTAVNSRLTFAFDGRNEYSFNCQYVDAQKTATLAGCDQILSSFKTTG